MIVCHMQSMRTACVYKRPKHISQFYPVSLQQLYTKMGRLNAADRNQAIGRLQAGESKSEVARIFNVHPSTITRLWNRFRETNSTNDRPRLGRPRVTTPAQDRYIRVTHLRDRLRTARDTAQEQFGARRVSDQTIRNRLREVGIRAKRPKVAPSLTRLHRRRRVRWCNTVLPWNLANWRRIWFSDE